MGAIHGSLDSVADGCARGWAQDVGEPQTPQQVRIVVDGVEVATGIAGAFRQDLADAGVGSGHAAFSIELPRQLRDAAPHVVEAYVGSTVLACSPQTLIWHPPFTAQDFDERAPWSDGLKGAVEIVRRLAKNQITPEQAALLAQWWEDGVVVLPGAISHALIDRLLDDVDRAWRDRPSVQVNVVGLGERAFHEIGERSKLPSTTYRIMNFQDFSNAAVDIMLHPRLTEFLQLIFEARPVAMQSLLFENGSEQRGHMDFAYVHTRNPSYLAAWVACEDVSPDAGPLFYYLASHRAVPKFDFGDGNILSFGLGPHNTAFEDHLEKASVELGLERRVYCPRKGDVLLWHSALVHGGSARKNSDLTRRSFVVHYSTEAAYPEDSRAPHRAPNVVERNGGVYYAR